MLIDLGCGTGRLSIASAYLQAKYILSVDIDIEALSILKRNIQKLELDFMIFPIRAEIRNFHIYTRNFPKNQKITTIMNPPFGVQKKKADRYFLETALTFSDVVYSIHFSSDKVRDFIRGFVNKFKWKIDNIFPYKLELEKSFPFHNSARKNIDVDIYRFKKIE